MNTRFSQCRFEGESEDREHLFDLSAAECGTVAGGRMKLPTAAPPSRLLTSPDGDPVSVYVDGVLINSPADGYAHL